jgi:hypothetical protein
MRFDVNVLVSVDVVDAGAVREAAWQIAANPVVGRLAWMSSPTRPAERRTLR